MGLGVMKRKESATIPRSPELERHNQMHYIHDTPYRGVLPVNMEYSEGILNLADKVIH